MNKINNKNWYYPAKDLKRKIPFNMIKSTKPTRRTADQPTTKKHEIKDTNAIYITVLLALNSRSGFT